MFGHVKLCEPDISNPAKEHYWVDHSLIDLGQVVDETEHIQHYVLHPPSTRFTVERNKLVLTVSFILSAFPRGKYMNDADYYDNRIHIYGDFAPEIEFVLEVSIPDFKTSVVSAGKVEQFRQSVRFWLESESDSE